MQVDFVIPEGNDPLEILIERKVGTVIKSYRPRMVHFGFASLKVYFLLDSVVCQKILTS
jgi:hypothetical protein